MKTSEQIGKLSAALVAAQMKIEAVTKNKVGKIAGKDGKAGYEYRYSDLASVIEHVKGPLNENNIAFLQSPSRADGGVVVTTRLLHGSGEWIEGETFVPVPAQTAQAYGSGISYGKRYGLQSMTGLPSEDDDGEKATEKTNGEARPNTAKQVAGDALSALSPDEQKFLHGEAVKILDAFERGVDMPEYVAAQNYDNEEKLALWFLLPSNVRTAIKRREPATIASQA